VKLTIVDEEAGIINMKAIGGGKPSLPAGAALSQSNPAPNRQ
jgi:hypothetical protein